MKNILEIGSGGNPVREATVLLDKYLDDTHGHRHGQRIRINRPFVQGDGEILPFKSKSFDKVIARHVIEHAINVEAFLNEMERISNRGYIECPSIVWEFMQPFRTNHKWLFFEIDRCLIISRNIYYNQLYSPLIKKLIQGSKSISLFRKSYKKIINIHFSWEDKIRYIIDPTNYQELLERYVDNSISLIDYGKSSEIGYFVDKNLWKFLYNVVRFLFTRQLFK